MRAPFRACGNAWWCFVCAGVLGWCVIGMLGCASTGESGAEDAMRAASAEAVAVEVLTFRVTPGLEQRFLEGDERTWTRALSAFPGYVSKESWIAPEGGRVVLVIRWRTRAEWPAIPPDRVAAIDASLQEWMGGPGTFTMESSAEYRVADPTP